MNWMLEPYRRYADFNGRSRRTEYWMFSLLFLGVYLAMAVLARIIGGPDSGAALAPLGVIGLFAIVSFVPSLAVGVRRLHDTNRSGWWMLITLLPVIGSFVLLAFCCMEGTRGPNRFGPDPKTDMKEVFA